MRKVVALGLMVAAIGLAACDSSGGASGGPRISRSFPVTGFDSIEVAGPYDVDVSTGGSPGVMATGPQKMIERLVVEVQGNRLLIHPQDRNQSFHINLGQNEGVRIRVTVPQLSAASIAGSGDMRVNAVKGPSFEANMAGSGDLNIDSIDVDQLKLALAGSGDVRAGNGRAQALKLQVGGSGDVDTKSVKVDQADISVAGSGDVAAHVTGAAQVSLLGSGDVQLTGGAKCQVSKMGSGDVRCS